MKHGQPVYPPWTSQYQPRHASQDTASYWRPYEGRHTPSAVSRRVFEKTAAGDTLAQLYRDLHEKLHGS